MTVAMLARSSIAIALGLCACQNYPRDIDGSLDRIERDRVFRVGLVSGNFDAAAKAKVAAFVVRVAHNTNAQPAISTGSSEVLLSRLEAGSLDLVIGELASDSPWIDDVALLEPISTRTEGKREIALAPIARNGENRWIMHLEKEVRDGRNAQ